MKRAKGRVIIMSPPTEFIIVSDGSNIYAWDQRDRGENLKIIRLPSRAVDYLDKDRLAERFA
jgi:hypothetical protein